LPFAERSFIDAARMSERASLPHEKVFNQFFIKGVKVGWFRS